MKNGLYFRYVGQVYLFYNGKVLQFCNMLKLKRLENDGQHFKLPWVIIIWPFGTLYHFYHHHFLFLFLLWTIRKYWTIHQSRTTTWELFPYCKQNYFWPSDHFYNKLFLDNTIRWDASGIFENLSKAQSNAYKREN